MYTEQFLEVQKYDVFKKCVSISILNFTLFKNEPEFYSCFRILEEKRHILYTDKMEFHVIELPKLPEELKGENLELLLWAKFINAESKEEFDMLATKSPYIDHAYQQLQNISQDKEKRLEYEAREKAIRDYNQGIFEAKQSGFEEGEKHSRERINKLNTLLIQDKRHDDLARSACDENFQRQLMEEYKI